MSLTPLSFFFFNDTATTEIYTLSLHDALPILVVDGLGNLRRERAGIADARGATEAHEIVAELVEILLQTRPVEVFRDHLGARRKRGLDPGFDGEPLGHRFAGE